jgi:hypothetical protein
MTERISIRRLSSRTNNGGMSAYIRYRRAGMAGYIAPRVPDEMLAERQLGPPAIGLGADSLRARYRTADLCPQTVIDDFFVPTATERAVEGFSMLHSHEWNSCAPANGSSPTRFPRRSGVPCSSRFPLSTLRRGSSAR